MRTSGLLRAAASAAILAFGTIPVAAGATSAQPQTLQLQTALTELYGSPFPYTGTLRLTIYPNGIVHGYYMPTDGSWQNVTGGITGNRIWLDLGPLNGADVQITGVIMGSHITGSALVGMTQYRFEAGPLTG